MLKRLAIFAFAALAAVSVAGQPDKTANRKDQPTTQGQPSVLSLNGHDKQDASQTNQAKPNGNTPAWNAAVEGAKVWWRDPNWWLVIVAGITGAFICWQSWETHKSAEATRKSVALSADANSQWMRLKLLNMYSEVEPGESDPPSTITLKCRWAILNLSTQPLTLHAVKVAVARDDAWHVCEFDFGDVVPPGEDGQIVIVPIPLSAKETAEYFGAGVEFSIAVHAIFSGVNGRRSHQDWGDLFYFFKGQVEWNAALGKGPQREYDERYESSGTMVPSEGSLYEFDGSPVQPRKRKEKPN